MWIWDRGTVRTHLLSSFLGYIVSFGTLGFLQGSSECFGYGLKSLPSLQLVVCSKCMYVCVCVRVWCVCMCVCVCRDHKQMESPSNIIAIGWMLHVFGIKWWWYFHTFSHFVSRIATDVGWPKIMLRDKGQSSLIKDMSALWCPNGDTHKHSIAHYDWGLWTHPHSWNLEGVL